MAEWGLERVFVLDGCGCGFENIPTLHLNNKQFYFFNHGFGLIIDLPPYFLKIYYLN